jgi:hypothetical protein
MGLAEFDKIENMSDRFSLPGQTRRQHSLLNRRQLLQAGVVGAAGLSLPRLLPPETRIYDQLGRPHTLAPGTPIMDLFD